MLLEAPIRLDAIVLHLLAVYELSVYPRIRIREACGVFHQHGIVGTDFGQVEHVGAGEIAFVRVEGRVGAGGDVSARVALGAG